MAEVLNVLRSAAFLRVANRTIMVEGEAHAPVPNSPGWVIHANAMRWDPPNDSEAVDDSTRQEVLSSLSEYFTREGIHFTVD